MIALLSPAKIMRSQPTIEVVGEPRFLAQAKQIVSMMTPYSSAELSEIFRISPALASELRCRFLDFYDAEPIAAFDSYNGVVYKHIKGREELAPEHLDYLQQHIRISSILYGLLRPLEWVKPYRMEGFVRLSDSDQRVDCFWRNVQTQTLIDDVKASGGVLLYLASKEEQNAFHWREVARSVRVIDFLFLQPKGDKLRQVVIYTKMARGEMVRYMMKNNINDAEELKAFEWGGYRFSEELSTDDVWRWVMD